ncbi:MAG TPA: hypothetical protein VJT14_14660 [Candidatus Dormibacteraeota bacterium]|nr:hypothetical protein [Candidatus Dormibacteraeota bacterium]
MNRLVGFALVGGFLASSAAAAAGANLVAEQGSASRALPAVRQPLSSVEQPVAAPAAPLAPSNTTHRTINATQAGTLHALPPAAAELAPASQASLSPCPPARTEVACRTP